MQEENKITPAMVYSDVFCAVFLLATSLFLVWLFGIDYHGPSDMGERPRFGHPMRATVGATAALMVSVFCIFRPASRYKESKTIIANIVDILSAVGIVFNAFILLIWAPYQIYLGRP